MLYSLWYNFVTEYKRIVGTGGLLVLFVVSVFYLYLRRNKNCSTAEAQDSSKLEHREPVDRKASNHNSVASQEEDGDGLDIGYELSALILAPMAMIAASVSRALKDLFKEIDSSETAGRAVKPVMRIVVVCMALFVLVISGKRIFSREFMLKAENNMHISSTLAEAMDYVLESAQAAGEDKAVFITNPKYSYYFEAYSSRLEAAYKEPESDEELSDYSEEDRDAYLELRDTFPNMSKVVRAAAKDNCRYIVLKAESYWPKVPLTELGFAEGFNNGEWIVYVAQGGNE